jgi:hypothetical protein
MPSNIDWEYQLVGTSESNPLSCANFSKKILLCVISRQESLFNFSGMRVGVVRGVWCVACGAWRVVRGVGVCVAWACAWRVRDVCEIGCAWKNR